PAPLAHPPAPGLISLPHCSPDVSPRASPSGTPLHAAGFPSVRSTMARERRFVRVLGRLGGRLPTLLVWAGLAGLFVYGAAHDWKLGGAKKDDKEEKKRPRPDDDRDGFTP